MTHTPGPWHIGGGGSANAPIEIGWSVNSPDSELRVWAADKAGVAEILTRKRLGEKSPSGEMLANGRLIAAAPELLSALRAMEKWGTKMERGEAHPDSPLQRARAAIANAEGI